MSTKKSSSPMQYRIEVGRDVLKKYYRNPDSAYRNYEVYCSIYPDLEVCLFDNLRNEIIYRKDGLTEVLKDVHCPDNRMKYKVVVKFNNGRVDAYRHFKLEISAFKYYDECVERVTEDWSGIVDSVELYDILRERVVASQEFVENETTESCDVQEKCCCNNCRKSNENFFTKFKNYLKECISNLTDKMNLF